MVLHSKKPMAIEFSLLGNLKINNPRCPVILEAGYNYSTNLIMVEQVFVMLLLIV